MRRIKIDLNQIEGFAYALQNSRDKIRSALKAAAAEWGQQTKDDYDSRSGHAILQGKASFSQVSESGQNGLRVSVGHEHFVAKFLEVGSKAHAIPHRQGRSWVVAHVKGIRGNKPLSKAVNARKKVLEESIVQKVEQIISE